MDENDNIPERHELLESIANQLGEAQFQKVQLGCLAVDLYRDGEKVGSYGVAAAVLYLANDMWMDSDARDIRRLDSADVRSI